MPGEKVLIEISYVETLKYEDGVYEFVFPMTVGPRYIPGSVQDAAKIKPPVAESRPGHDISIEVNLNAGVPVEEIRSTSHQIEQVNISPSNAKVTLKDEKTIPNKDFVFRYDVSGKRIEDAVLAHRGERGGFFTLVLQPPDKFAPEDRTPKEIVFVLDTSGSMSGFPIEKAKEAMKLSLDGLYPEDTFNLITFAGDTHVLFEEPVPATQANLEKAQAFLESRTGGGGTEMMTAIKAALDPSDSKEHIRIVCFMTDAFVGNDNEIIAEIQKHPKARVFSFGIGTSVNRFLLDKMAEAGNGEVEYVSLEDDGSKAAKRFYERVRTPLLTDLSIEWNGMPVTDVYPSKIGDLFSAKPVIVNGRFTKPATGAIKLKGKVAGMPYEREIAVNLPAAESANDVLATLWARKRVDELSSDALKSKTPQKVNDEITNLGLDFGILTNFTSFVAVEERIVNQNGKPVKVQVPVAIPEGVDRKMAVGDVTETVQVSALPVNGRAVSNMALLSSGAVNATVDVSSGKSKSRAPVKASRKNTGSGTGYGSGSGGGSGSGYGYGSGGAPPPVTKSSVTTPLQIISKPRATLTEETRTANVQGSVRLKVELLATGHVGAITPITRLPLGLTEQAIAAARQITFKPRMVNGVAATDVITVDYTFSIDQPEPVIYMGDSNIPPTPEMLRDQKLKEKLHSWVYALVNRLRLSNKDLTPNEATFVRDGTASIKIELSAKSPEVLAKLKAAGFEIAGEKGNTVTGKIAVEKLAALAEIAEVKLILPRTV